VVEQSGAKGGQGLAIERAREIDAGDLHTNGWRQRRQGDCTLQLSDRFVHREPFLKKRRRRIA